MQEDGTAHGIAHHTRVSVRAAIRRETGLYLANPPELREWQLQKGLREHLLCEECEGRLNRLETPSSLALRAFLDAVDGTPPGKRHVHVPGHDGRIVWETVLSVLWRAAVAQNSYFSRVDLGPHQERLRLLLRGESGALEDYPCLIAGRRAPTNAQEAAMVPPQRLRLWGCTVYQLHLPRLTWVIFVASHRPPGLNYEPALPDADGGLTGIVARKSEDEFIEGMIQKAGRAYRRACPPPVESKLRLRRRIRTAGSGRPRRRRRSHGPEAELDHPCS